MNSVQLGDYAFYDSLSTVISSIGMNELIIDLPNLDSIILGWCTLQGRDDDSCSLIMKSDNCWINWYSDLPNLTIITSGGYNFYEPRLVTLSSILLNDWIIRYSESENSQLTSIIRVR